jgi:hypothetical protein
LRAQGIIVSIIERPPEKCFATFEEPGAPLPRLAALGFSTCAAHGFPVGADSLRAQGIIVSIPILGSAFPEPPGTVLVGVAALGIRTLAAHTFPVGADSLRAQRIIVYIIERPPVNSERPPEKIFATLEERGTPLSISAALGFWTFAAHGFPVGA